MCLPFGADSLYPPFTPPSFPDLMLGDRYYVVRMASRQKGTHVNS